MSGAVETSGLCARLVYVRNQISPLWSKWHRCTCHIEFAFRHVHHLFCRRVLIVQNIPASNSPKRRRLALFFKFTAEIAGTAERVIFLFTLRPRRARRWNRNWVCFSRMNRWWTQTPPEPSRRINAVSLYFWVEIDTILWKFVNFCAFLKSFRSFLASKTQRHEVFLRHWIFVIHWIDSPPSVPCVLCTVYCILYSVFCILYSNCYLVY